ncbi:hypothetical protein Egran_04582 [Elaphomyces granulatus]|uniref:Phospholipid-transporting ATPase n=1 Tax=Elaphomyces granulatus TaxID=519963 RepID=A0A232LU47_9EURO|nr:hypothetical protein Egran_04582 [Elaphomyces granulatus]
MSLATEYLHGVDMDTLPSGSDSEDDLDLEELDPQSTEISSNARRYKEDHNEIRGFGTRIAMRNLRTGARGRLWKQETPGYHRRSEEDFSDLLDDRSDKQQLSQGSSNPNEDNIPLLRNHRRGGSPLPEPKVAKQWLTFGGMLGLPSFRSTSETQTSPDTSSDSKPVRSILAGQSQDYKFPANLVSNAKYTAWSFLPRTLYNEFSFFFNMYFLLVALSQIIPVLRIGYISSYIAPLAFVVSVSLGKEAYDDIGRRRRDAEANSEEFTVLSFGRRATKSPRIYSRAPSMPSSQDPDTTGITEVTKKSRDLKVGDVLKIRKDQRLPADVVILRSIATEKATSKLRVSSNEESSQEPVGGVLDAVEDGSVVQSDVQSRFGTDSTSDTFIRTDQLDGETDWKLRFPPALSQNLPLSEFTRLKITGGAPDCKVNEFVGKIELVPSSSNAYDPSIGKLQPSNDETLRAGAPQNDSVALTIDNTAWANTVLASNTTTLAVILYTGPQTRSALSTSPSRSKVGLLEYEINSLTKILCILTLTLSFTLVALEGFQPTNDKPWYIAIMIYLILFSTIIPMSLRVNLDMAKTVYARFIERDRGIPDTIVRTSTIPEDLGRIEYLLSDKTGTLTQNEMELKKIHVGTVSYANEAMEEVALYIRQGFANHTAADSTQPSLITPSSVFPGHSAAARTRREIGSRVRDLVLALALCHNVTPTMGEEDGHKVTSYQASSPDEIAIVKYVEGLGLRLAYRDRQSIILESSDRNQIVVRVRILEIFPFTSESKRMGVIVQFEQDAGAPDLSKNDSDIWFYQKGADTVMSSIVAANDWLDEETANMAREGLRTLVVGRKKLSTAQYQQFSADYKQASLALQGRDAGMATAVSEYLERDLELLGVTGVEDRLQRDVKPSLELLRNAGIKIWMLTGDKVETARCVAISSKLVARGQYIHTVTKLQDRSTAQNTLDFLIHKTDACLLIDGESLSIMLSQFRLAFISIAVLLPVVVACRCSPAQKAEIADLIRQHTKKRICCIGDGGNDVSMIQAADVGIGIVGKEGRQASLAADFSITQFHHLTKLLVWHGRNSYKRSAKLGQFIMHRGLIISACQTMYSIASHFDPKGLFINWLLVGYATVYTNAPVFSLVLDRDVDEELANLYPELYKELKTGRSLSYRSFFTWVLVSVYQGAVIEGLSQILVGAVTGPRLISVSFTALVLNELMMVAIAVTTWHPVMIFSLLGTVLLYAANVPFLGDYFDLEFVITIGWLWRVAAVLAVSLVPVWVGKLVKRVWSPPSYRKVQG